MIRLPIVLALLVCTFEIARSQDAAPPEVIIIENAGERGVFIPCRMVTTQEMRVRLIRADKEASELGMFSTLKYIYAAFKEPIAGCRKRKASP